MKVFPVEVQRLLIYGGSRGDRIQSASRANTHTKSIHHKFPVPNVAGDDITVVGSSNGLLCLKSNVKAMYIWNPSINEYREIPQSSSQLEDSSKLNTFMGFGFNVIDDDYKLVKVVCHWGCWQSVEVYSMKNDSWRHIGVKNLPFRFNDEYDIPITIHGCIHWISLHYGRKNSNYYGIVSFDLADEFFCEMSFPNDISTKGNVFRMGIYEGCLCLFCYDELYVKDCEVWVMREYGVGESWKKEFSIPNVYGLVKPFTSSECGGGRGSEVLLENHYGDLVLYDPKEVKLVDKFEDELNVGDDEFDKSQYHVASYVLSQVSVCVRDDSGKRKRKRSLRNKDKDI